MRRFCRWLWVVVAVPVLLVALGVPVVWAAPAPRAIELLQRYGLVKGDPQGDLMLGRPITRAEMVTVLIRALGREGEAVQYRGTGPFLDARGHWAEGYLALGAQLGLVRGDGNGRARPDDPVSYAEALTFILRLVGREPRSGEWPQNILVASVQHGLWPADVAAEQLPAPALRGHVFASLATAITTIRNAEGKTFLQTYIDRTPPVLSLSPLPTTTRAATVRVTGTVQDAATVTINGTPARLEGGRFDGEVSLEVGTNSIRVEAADLAGNVARSEARVVRLPPLARIEITGPAKVRPGSPVTYQVTGKDPQGNPTPLENPTATVEGGIGTFDVRTGRFVPHNTPGRGRIVVTAEGITGALEVQVLGPNPAAARLTIRPLAQPALYNQPVTVQVEVQDAAGRLLEDDYGRAVTLSASGLQGLTVTPAQALTEGGVATFTLRSSATGQAILLAASGNLPSDTRTVQFASGLRVRLAVEPATLTLGTSTPARIRATLVNAAGTPTPNPGEDVVIRLAATGGTLADDTVRIPRAATSATTDVGLLVPGVYEGTFTVTGTVVAGEALPVEPANYQVSAPSLPAGAYWEVSGNPTQTPDTEATITVRLRTNSGTVQGSWAFQLTVSTSNNEPVTMGLPQGVSIRLEGTAYNPVSDGIPEGAPGDGNDVIVRTAGGTATFKLRYDKPGQVTVGVVPVGTVPVAYGPDGTPGPAAGSLGAPVRPLTITFTGTATAVRLEVDSDLGRALPAGATAPASGRPFTLHAVLVDSAGRWIPNATAAVTLVRESGTATQPPVTQTVQASGGRATFLVSPGPTPGADTYRVTARLGTEVRSNPVTLQVDATPPQAPVIVAARGVRDGTPGLAGYVGPDDTHLEIELAQAQGWALVRVYPQGGGSPLYTSPPVDLAGLAPRVLVPRGALPAGVQRLQLSYVNGAGEGPRSAPTDAITVAVYTPTVTLSAARYDRGAQVITLFGSGFGAGDRVDPSRLAVEDESTGQRVTLDGAAVTIGSYDRITLQLAGTPAAQALADLTAFSGPDVKVTAQAGWYARGNGELATATRVPLTPMARLDYAVFDRNAARLLLVGEGFTTGNLDPGRLHLTAPGQPDISLAGLGSARLSDTQWALSLTPPIVQSLTAQPAYALAAAGGWFGDGAAAQTGVGPVPVYAQIGVAGATYDRASRTLRLQGSGYAGGTATPDRLQVADLSTGQRLGLAGTWTVQSDGELAIVLNEATAAALADRTRFQGDDLYLVGDPGWFTDATGRAAAPIPLRWVRLPEP